MSEPPCLYGREEDSSPEVSIVIRTLNGWDELARRGFCSALAQERVSLEVIVDDGSNTSAPGSPPFDDPRVWVIRHEANAGSLPPVTQASELHGERGSRFSTMTICGPGEARVGGARD